MNFACPVRTSQLPIRVQKEFHSKVKKKKYFMFKLTIKISKG